MLKQSICYPIFKDAAPSPEEFCRLAASIGFQGIDLWSGDDLAALSGPATAHGLTLTGFVGTGPLEKGLNQSEHHDDQVQSLRAAVDLAVRHRVPTLIVLTGNRTGRQSDYEALVQCAICLRRIAPYAEAHGVSLCVELLNSRVDHTGYLADRSDFGFALCEMVNSPAVKLLFDIYHMQIMEGDVISRLRTGIGQIGHIHTAGVPGRHDLDHDQELNYPAIFRSLSAVGYQGFVGHEFWPKGDKVAAMRQAFGLCAGSAPTTVRETR